MLLATPLLQQLGFWRPWAAESGQPVHALPDNPARLEQEESGHRLANLLQIVLCNLERTADGAAKLTIDAAKDQVSSVCRLQDLLNGHGADERPVAGHLRALGETLEALLLRLGGHCLTIEVDATAEGLLLPARTLSRLGQLVAEAVMNAAKHAFPAGPGGRVVLRLSRAETWLSCVVVDDGVGSRRTLRRIGSRGMILTDALAQRAGGRCAWVFGQHGTEVRIAWPIKPSGQEMTS